MLPRNLLSLASRTAIRRQALQVQRHTYSSPPFRIATSGVYVQRAAFHASSSWRDELPKSPFQTFVEVLKDELKKNRELQENVKQLQGDVDKFQDSEAMKKARAAYERARVRLRLFNLSFVAIVTRYLSSLRQVSKRIQSYGQQLRN